MNEQDTAATNGTKRINNMQLEIFIFQIFFFYLILTFWIDRSLLKQKIDILEIFTFLQD
jgi:hypothetical protein